MHRTTPWLLTLWILWAGCSWSCGGASSSNGGTSGNATITWSVPSLTATMFPGVTSTLTATVRSDKALTSVALAVTPTLNGIVSVSPASFSLMTANQEYLVTFTLAAPSTFTKNLYTGTVQLQTSVGTSTTYGQPLSVAVQTDWNTTSDTAGGVTTAFPTAFTARSYDNTVTISSTTVLRVRDGDPGNEFEMVTLPLNNSTTLRGWLEEYYRGQIDWNSTPTDSYTNPAGVQFLIVRAVPAFDSDNINAFTIVGTHVVRLSVCPASQYQSLFSSILSSMVLQ